MLDSDPAPLKTQAFYPGLAVHVTREQGTGLWGHAEKGDRTFSHTMGLFSTPASWDPKAGWCRQPVLPPNKSCPSHEETPRARPGAVEAEWPLAELPGCHSGNAPSAQEEEKGAGSLHHVSEGDSACSGHLLGKMEKTWPEEALQEETRGNAHPLPNLSARSGRACREGLPCRPQPSGDSTERTQGRGSASRAEEEESAGGQLVHDTGSRAVLRGGPQLLGRGPSSLALCRPLSRAQGSPHALQADLAGLTPGFCYLCTMSLISFTELRSLLKS